MSLTAMCHCGSVRVEVPTAPTVVSDCNCSICRRYGVLWAYYEAADVKVHADRYALDDYSWNHKRLRFVRCKACGCVMHWERVVPVAGSHMGVNARNFEPELLKAATIELLDGASDES